MTRWVSGPLAAILLKSGGTTVSPQASVLPIGLSKWISLQCLSGRPKLECSRLTGAPLLSPSLGWVIFWVWQFVVAATFFGILGGFCPGRRIGRDPCLGGSSGGARHRTHRHSFRSFDGKTEIQTALTQGRGQIQTDAQIKLQQVLNYYGAGILITEIRLERVDPPGQVIEAFRDVQAAEADKESFQNEAQAYANSIIPEARGNAVRVIQEAEAYKEQVIARATGEASRFLAVYLQYSKAKDVTRKRIYLETMEEIFAGMNKIIIDEGAGTGVIPYLPLPELRSRQNSGEGDSK